VWEKAHKLTLACYASTARFPRGESFGLISQIRRCSASIGANIAEGCGKNSDPDFGRFVHIASGSARELESHLLLARDLGYLHAEAHGDLQDGVLEIQRMLASLTGRIRRSSDGRPAVAAM
jgi:four helix bundle protein